MIRMFEAEYEQLLERQKRTASGQRLEMLSRDLSGTKQMLKAAVWPVLGTLQGITLELELISRNGVKVYVDAFAETASLALESDGYVAHAQNITRDRFAFERRKIRTIAAYGYIYVPFSRDELESTPMACSSSFAELLGRYGGNGIEETYNKLNVYEREVLRYGRLIHRQLRLSDVLFCLGCGTVWPTWQGLRRAWGRV